MTPYVQTIVDKIANEMDHDEILSYFGEKCYMAKTTFSEIVEYFIESTNFEVLYAIFKSEHFKKNNMILDSYNEPIVHSIMYAIYAVATVHDETLTEPQKLEIKDGFIKLLTDESLPFVWNMTDLNIDNPIHLALTHWECYQRDEILKIMELSCANGVSPLNRNDMDCNAFDTLFSCDEFPDDLKNDIMDILVPMCDDSVIEIEATAYAATE
jgi:hypothetical protein